MRGMGVLRAMRRRGGGRVSIVTCCFIGIGIAGRGLGIDVLVRIFTG